MIKLPRLSVANPQPRSSFMTAKFVLFAVFAGLLNLLIIGGVGFFLWKLVAMATGH